ncbi:MAG: hypothetical protein ACF8XB_17570, partial [Planctomycetota bacterium JB042]
VAFPIGAPARVCFARGPAVTDAGGRFRLPRPEAADAILVISGPDVFQASFLAPEDDEPRDYPVARGARVRVVVPPLEPPADSFAVLDAADEPLRVERAAGANADLPERWVDRIPLTGDEPPVIRVPEDAAALVLLRGGEVVARRPLDLDPQVLNLVAW